MPSGMPLTLGALTGVWLAGVGGGVGAMYWGKSVAQPAVTESQSPLTALPKSFVSQYVWVSSPNGNDNNNRPDTRKKLCLYS